MSYVKIGVAGPVGSGKTALIEALSRKMANDYSIGVITNDIYTKEDAQFLAKNSVLPVERIIGVETGGCPHTAIREDASMNLEAVDEMMERFPDIELLFIESGGDNLSATFSPELVDATIFVIDVAEGDKIPRKGGPGITRSDLLVINKIDLAPYVGASLEVMEHDSKKMRGERPFLFTNIRGDVHVDDVVSWIKENVLLEGMLMENKFGKISRITACAALKNGKTILEDLSFTAPYKIMAPFAKENGGIQIMPLCASAGIMEGDSQEFSYHVKEGADLEVLSQSFEKIHKMDEGSASRTISVQVDPHAVLYYYPQPVIPFAQSSFTSTMTIHLADETSRLFLLEIISCGRNAHEERFQYRRFASKVQIFRGQKLIYRDNTCYLPDQMPMEGIGMYEGYTHMANLFLSRTEYADTLLNEIREILDGDPEIDGGATTLSGGDLAVRIFGHRAQKLQQTAEKIKTVYEKLL